MANIQRRPVKKVRLQHLASDAGLPITPSQPPIVEDRSWVAFAHQSHSNEARDLLSWRRTWDPEFKASSSSLGSRTKEPNFGLDEVNRAIRAAVDQNASLGVIDALLEFALGSKASLWDKMKGRDQQISWLDLITNAVRQRNYDLLRLLASKTDQRMLNSSLPIAIRSQDIPATRILLERGADLSDYHADFTSTIKSSTEMAELLISAPRPPCSRCLADALFIAAEAKSVHLVGILVQRGADANWRNWAALMAAVQNLQKEVLLALVSSPNAPSSDGLDGAMGLLYTVCGSDARKASPLAEILLCAGAHGEHTAKFLISAVGNRQTQLVDLLVKYGASVDFYDGLAIRNAISVKDKPLLVRILRGKPSPDTLSKVLCSSQSAILQDLKYTKDIIGNFLAVGLADDAVDRFLYEIVQISCAAEDVGQREDGIELIRMLLDGGYANINSGDAASLRMAAKTSRVDILRLLLSSNTQPTKGSLSVAFSEATQVVAMGTARLDTLTVLLDAGARGIVVDQALIDAVQEGSSAMDETKRLLLVASVDYCDGMAIRAAICNGYVEQLDLLLARQPLKTTLRPVWECAAGLELSDFKYVVYKRLLELDASTAPLDRELVAAVAAGSAGRQMWTLLLEYGACVDSEHGAAFTAAIDTQTSEALEDLLARKPLVSSLDGAARHVWGLSSSSRLEFARTLLTYGLGQSSRDLGLLAILDENEPPMDLVTMLLNFGASPEHNDGESLSKAVQLGNAVLLASLVARVIDPQNLNNALATLLWQNGWATNIGLSLLGTLLSYGAQGPCIESAFLQACTDYNTPACDILLRHLNSPAVLSEGLKTIFVQDATWQFTNGLTIVEKLLSCGANTPVIQLAFVEAASAYNLSAMRLLWHYVSTNAEVVMFAWRQMILTSDRWMNEDCLPMLEMLLASGGGHGDVNLALVQAIASSSRDNGQEHALLVDLLLRYGADPLCNGAEPLRLAARKGIPAVLGMLCRCRPPIQTLWCAFFDILSGHAQNNSEQAMACIRHLVGSGGLDLNLAPEGMDLPLIRVLTKYSGSPELVSLLVKVGANVMSMAVCPILLAGADDWHSAVGGDGRTRAAMRFAENVPALLWALLRRKDELVDSVIEVLVELGADVNFAMPHLRFTPLILASKHDRPAIVAKLLGSGAIRDARDNFQNTALFYASRHGYYSCVELLARDSTAVNDGSLHEATRNLHAETVHLLIQAGHNPNFPSEIHGGRTPLAELCFLADASSSAACRDTIRTLASGGADPLRQCADGTKSIFLALSNREPKPVVEVIAYAFPSLSFSDPRLVLQVDGLAYSPTMYLKKLVLPTGHGNVRRSRYRLSSAESHLSARSMSPYPEEIVAGSNTHLTSRAFHIATTATHRDLLEVLSQLGVVDRFYYTGTSLPQPSDMTGAPEAIAELEYTRRARLEGKLPPLSDNRDELHLSSTHMAGAQWQAAEQSRQFEGRRTLALLVEGHIQQAEDLRREAAKLVREGQNKARLDHQGMQTAWIAEQLALAARLGVAETLEAVQQEQLMLKECETMQRVSEARRRRIRDYENARDNKFLTAEEKRIAARLGGGGYEYL